MARATSPSRPPDHAGHLRVHRIQEQQVHLQCKSGAILTGPAVKPDFSSDRGACATHILRPITNTAWPKDKSISSSQLEDLLRDQNPEIRKAAVKSAKNYILNSYAQDRVLDILKNRNERSDIRVEAARTLSYAGGYSRVQDASPTLSNTAMKCGNSALWPIKRSGAPPPRTQGSRIS